MRTDRFDLSPGYAMRILMTWVCASVLGSVSGGCASFPGHELATLTYDPPSGEQARPSVDYDLTFTAFGSENVHGLALFRQRVEEVFRRSNQFSGFHDGIGQEPYHLSLTLNNHGSRGLAVLSGMITGLSLMTIPGYARDGYRLTASVTAEGKLLKTYEYNDHISTWFHLFLIVLTPSHQPGKVSADVIDNMLLSFLRDLRQDGLLAPIRSEAGRPSD